MVNVLQLDGMVSFVAQDTVELVECLQLQALALLRWQRWNLELLVVQQLLSTRLFLRLLRLITNLIVFLVVILWIVVEVIEESTLR